ncbi:MAG: threonine/serine dehydratase [Elusimicrobia bacterium]|nr:threonine/serine dehydratase [Elusimicrobiota bacterium]
MSAVLSTPLLPLTFNQILQTSRRIRPYIPPTPLRSYASLNGIVGKGIEVWIKHENHNPTNSFKARNALSVITALSHEEARSGVVAASKGNHGQGLAWAGQLFGITATIFVPKKNSPAKNEAIKGYGAGLIEVGKNYDEAALAAQKYAKNRSMRLVHATNDPDVLSGAATVTLEILEQNTEVEALVVPIGGGSLAAGAIAVAREIRPELPIYGVQAGHAPAVYESWKAGRRLHVPCKPSIADGLATSNAYASTFNSLQTGLTGLIAVSEQEIARAVRLICFTTHNMAEGAGAAGLAGLLALRPQLAGKKVGIILSGSNIDETTLEQILSTTKPLGPAGRQGRNIIPNSALGETLYWEKSRTKKCGISDSIGYSRTLENKS